MKKYNKLPTLISSVLIVMSVSAYGQEPLSPEELEKFITINAQEIVDAREERAALRRQFDQKLKQLKVTVDNLVTTLKTQIDSQQRRIAALETENQRLTTGVSSNNTQIDTQQQRIAALEKENQRLANLVKAQRQEKQQLQQKVAQMNNEIAGLKHRTLRYIYIDNGDGTITDNRSGLTWLKNANCFGKQNWYTAMQSAKNLKHGQCGLRDGSIAGMWRLPTRDEWKAMVDKRYQNPPLSNAVGTDQWKEGNAFSSVQSKWYWSSTSTANDTSNAWLVGLGSGNVFHGHKAYSYYVWPVRRRQ